MAANSLTRRIVKRVVGPLLDENRYSYLQTAAMAWDIASGNWSEPELDLIPLAVREGDTVLDIGANFGLYAHHLSKAVGATGKVYAFEPVPFTYKTLRRVAKVLRFRNVEIVPKGCSDKAGEVTFHVPLSSMGTMSAGVAYIGTRNEDHPGHEKQVRWKAVKPVRAELVVIDDFLPPVRELSLVKCDVEGAELFTFLGATKTIEKHLPNVICEINPWYLEGFGVKTEQLLSYFSTKGYELYFYDHHRRLLVPRRPDEVVEDNYVFVHPRRRDRLASLLGS